MSNKKKEGIPLVCGNCNYGSDGSWKYKGRKTVNAQCPDCNTRVKIPKK